MKRLIFIILLSISALVFIIPWPIPDAHPSAFHQGMAMEALPEGDMIVAKSGDNQFDILYKWYGDHTQIIRFIKKDRGTWNIDGWYCTDNLSRGPEGYTLLAGGDTDWEYVFRVSDSQHKPLEFSGGNHGKELLKSIDITTGNEILDPDIMEPGQQKQASRIAITEHSILTYDKECRNKYAEVVRNYTIQPSKISLETHISFTSDTFMGTSYVCMFPVSKTFGTFIGYNDSGHIYRTPPLGETLTNSTFENFIGREKALSVVIWGDVIPEYKFEVRIDNGDMVDNFNNELKVFYWDVNKYTNKLYFSKYDTRNPQKIEKNTVWNTKAEWTLKRTVN